ncbi:molybdopterin-binding protein [Sphingopyxis sp. EG6]|uniref:molybdopterin-binding protein n=1 Tax=Sphingopyxis sp. EG6 TaxID=1874061 RepID=UPI000DC62097|nr:molybdopterin-binding protein [Sphingopyxis sp. EG6]MEA3264705.1 molybdopterin-binding protein [Pseudomonadota bacterium]BBB08506.1 molybdopterin-binding oxidoreductase [Sphingopyxis sp. EG6]
MITRRRLVGSLALGGGGLLLSGCDRVAATPAFRGFVEGTEGLTRDFTRLVSARDALAREFTTADLSPVFRANGTTNPGAADYQALAAGQFADYRLAIDGLVRRPLTLSLAQLRGLPQRSQITRHDCVEGWSAIGGWTGPQLGPLLRHAGLLPQAKYIVFHCADDFGSSKYYESIDLVDAFHPQTILAHALNGQALPIANGAPIRLRVERQLGYKHAKYVMRVQAVASLAGIGAGKGGYWEDSNDYAWYAGI